jgi:hypothetical protein
MVTQRDRGARSSSPATIPNQVSPFIDLADAKRVESRTARRQNASVQLRTIFLEGERSSPSVLHFKGFKGDGFLNTRVRQLQQLVLPRLSWPSRRSAPATSRRATNRDGFLQLAVALATGARSP